MTDHERIKQIALRYMMNTRHGDDLEWIAKQAEAQASEIIQKLNLKEE